MPDEAITTELVVKVRSLCRPVKAGSLAASALVGSALVADGSVVMVVASLGECGREESRGEQRYPG